MCRQRSEHVRSLARWRMCSTPQEPVDELRDRRGAPIAQGQRDALLEGAESCRANEVRGLEEILEAQLLALGLQQEATPLVERRRAQATEDHHDEEHLRRRGLPTRGGRQGPDGAVVAADAVHDVTNHRGPVGLVDVAPLHLELHGLAVAEVRHGQGRSGEDEASDDASDGGVDGQSSAQRIDGLEEGELQEVRGERGLQVLQHHAGLHIIDGVHELHALHQDAVHDRLADSREHRLDDRGHGAGAHRIEDLRRDAGRRCRRCLARSAAAGGTLPVASAHGARHEELLVAELGRLGARDVALLLGHRQHGECAVSIGEIRHPNLWQELDRQHHQGYNHEEPAASGGSLLRHVDAEQGSRGRDGFVARTCLGHPAP
mmetsp:Transcript_79943/g.203483  ORF Transcript_79943/g.203483 Transcript_79943/m.203483 type:complete len:375 (-) Transcript_79943:12-1136(-)